MTTQTNGIAINAIDLEDGHEETEYCQPYMLLFVLSQLNRDGFQVLTIENANYTEYHYTDDDASEF